jgi:type IV pilus assembly protein PilV
MRNEFHLQVMRKAYCSGQRFQQGFLLLEGMIAILVFSIGILSLIQLQAVAVREISESKVRSDASYLADRVAGDLNTLDLITAQNAGDTTLAAYDGTYIGGVAYGIPIQVGWAEYLLQHVPGGMLTVNVVATADALDATRVVNMLSVIVMWPNRKNPPTGSAPFDASCMPAPAGYSCFSQVAQLVR